MSDNTLRSGLIRLAFQNPDLRPALLPLLSEGSVKTAGGPDSTGRNWKKYKTTGMTHWIWQGRPGEPIKQFMVIQKKAGAFDNSYWMTVKLEDGSFFQSAIQKVKPTYWFKRASEIYAASQTAMPDFSNMPENWKQLTSAKAAASANPYLKYLSAGPHPLGRMAIVYFDLAMEDYNVEEDAGNGDEFAQSLLDDVRNALKLESDALKSLSRMFGARIMNEGHDSGGGLVCKFAVDSWDDVKKALSVINRNHEGGDDQIGTGVPYMVARDFRLYPDGVNNVFYGEGSGAEGDWNEWLSEHKD